MRLPLSLPFLSCLIFLCLSALPSSSAVETYYDSFCSKEEAIKSFKEKKLVGHVPFLESDPYEDITEEKLTHIHSTINNQDIVCALKFVDEAKTEYILETFANYSEAHKQGFIITH